MKRWMMAWGVLLFSLLVLGGAPVALWARALTWPDGWQPQGLSGTLWQGQAAQLGPLGPLSWQLALSGPQAEVHAGALQRQWHLQLRGWPWHWQASLQDAGSLASAELPFSLEGAWQGRIELHGRGLRCLASSGSLTAAQLDLLTPWAMPLGRAQLQLDCQERPHLLARLERPGQHRFNLDADLEGRTSEVNGQLEAGAELAGLLRQLGLLGPEQQTLQTRFTW